MPGELPLVLLALLAEAPRGGYQLLNELARRFAPTYRPSPGSVYPALAALRAESLVEQLSGKQSGSYRITTSGKRMLSAKRDLLAQIESRTNTELADAQSLQPALARFAAGITNLTGRVDRAAVERILDNAAKAIAELEVAT